MTESKVDDSRRQFEEVMRSVWWGDSFHAERHPKAPDEYLKAPEQMAWIGWQAAMCSLPADKPASEPIYYCSHCKLPNHAGADHADCESVAELNAALAQNTQEGPGEEDGPWAEGWSERSSNAQNTQREGEAVAYVEEYDLDGRHCRGLVWADHPANTPGHTFTPLTYLHAERARVPDVDAMVSRFLGWTLPKDFAPDAGISFKPIPNPHGDPYPWPTGTNLLHAGQAKAMFEYVLAVAPSQRAEVK